MKEKHRIPVGTLVELSTGIRLWIVKHTYNDDVAPRYSLGMDFNSEGCTHEYEESSLKII